MYERAAAAIAADAAPAIDLFVPGRLCLFGEHSDWALYEASGGSTATSCLVKLWSRGAAGARRRVLKYADELVVTATNNAAKK